MFTHASRMPSHVSLAIPGDRIALRALHYSHNNACYRYATVNNPHRPHLSFLRRLHYQPRGYSLRQRCHDIDPDKRTLLSGRSCHL